MSERVTFQVNRRRNPGAPFESWPFNEVEAFSFAEAARLFVKSAQDREREHKAGLPLAPGDELLVMRPQPHMDAFLFQLDALSCIPLEPVSR